MSSPSDQRVLPSTRTADVLGLLTALVIVTLLIPSALIVKPLGAAGTPAEILGILLLGWWALSKVLSHEPSKTTLIHVWLGIFVAAMLMSYLHGMLRPITGAELSSADRGLLILLAWSGTVLAIADGLSSLITLRALLFRMTVMGGIVAGLGITQFFTGLDVASIIRIPGLVANHPFGEAGERSAYRRVTATALHPIEFGIVLALLLPIAFYFALNGDTRRQRRVARVCTALILVAMPMTVARSAMVGLAVVLVMLFFSWSPRYQFRALLIAPFAAVGMKLAVPGLLGTIRNLFLHAGQDPSIQNRLGDYSAAGFYISQSPFLGRGFFTFLPNMYRTLDNQYMGTLIEAGVIGLLAFLGVMVVGAATGIRIRRRSADPSLQNLAYALTTSMVTALVTFFTFDAMAFPMVMGVLFILFGCQGSLTRIAVGQTVMHGAGLVSAIPQHGGARHAARIRSRLLLTRLLVGGLAVLTLAFGTLAIDRTPARYAATGSLVLAGAPPAASLAAILYTSPRYLGDFPTMLAESVESPSERLLLRSMGHTGLYEIAVGNGSLEPQTDVVGSGELMRVGVTADTPEQALGTMNAVIQRIEGTMRAWQVKYDVKPDAAVRVQAAFLPSSAVAEKPSRHRADGILFVLVFWSWWLVDRAIRRRNPSVRSVPGSSAVASALGHP